MMNERWLYWHDGARDRDMARLDIAVALELPIPGGAVVVPKSERSRLAAGYEDVIGRAQRLARDNPGMTFGVDMVVRG